MWVCNALQRVQCPGTSLRPAFVSKGAKGAKEMQWHTWHSYRRSQRNTINQGATLGGPDSEISWLIHGREMPCPVSRLPGLGDLHKSKAIGGLRRPGRPCQHNHDGDVAGGASNRSGCTGEQYWGRSVLTLVAASDWGPSDHTEDRASR